MIDSKELGTTHKLHPDTLLESKPCKDLMRPKLIAIGASTGGVDVLSTIFEKQRSASRRNGKNGRV